MTSAKTSKSSGRGGSKENEEKSEERTENRAIREVSGLYIYACRPQVVISHSKGRDLTLIVE